MKRREFVAVLIAAIVARKLPRFAPKSDYTARAPATGLVKAWRKVQGDIVLGMKSSADEYDWLGQ